MIGVNISQSRPQNKYNNKTKLYLLANSSQLPWTPSILLFGDADKNILALSPQNILEVLEKIIDKQRHKLQWPTTHYWAVAASNFKVGISSSDRSCYLFENCWRPRIFKDRKVLPVSRPIRYPVRARLILPPLDFFFLHACPQTIHVKRPGSKDLGSSYFKVWRHLGPFWHRLGPFWRRLAKSVVYKWSFWWNFGCSGHLTSSEKSGLPLLPSRAP